jgi:hypothetical protein
LLHFSALPVPGHYSEIRANPSTYRAAFWFSAHRALFDAKAKIDYSQRLTAQQFGYVADQAGGFANEQLLEIGHAIDQAEADVADKP